MDSVSQEASCCTAADGSGLQAVNSAAHAIMAGDAEIIVAGVAAFGGGDPEGAARRLVEACR